MTWYGEMIVICSQKQTLNVKAKEWGSSAMQRLGDSDFLDVVMNLQC